MAGAARQLKPGGLSGGWPSTSADGNVAWAIQTGGEAEDSVGGLTVFNSNEVYVSGYFSDTAVFGEGEPNETTLTADDLADIFVAKFILTE